MAEGNPFSGLFDDEKKADNPFVGLFDTKTLSEEDADLENFSYEQFQQSPKYVVFGTNIGFGIVVRFEKTS